MSTPSPTASATPTPTATLTPTPTTQAINLSTRMRVQTGDNVGIGGFIITGSEPKPVILRAIGPSLTSSGILDPLVDPVLELHGPTGFVTMVNNNWRGSSQERRSSQPEFRQPTIWNQPLWRPWDPGAYTAIVKGLGNTSGIALVEIYDLNQEVDSKLANLSTRAQVVDAGTTG